MALTAGFRPGPFQWRRCRHNGRVGLLSPHSDTPEPTVKHIPRKHGLFGTISHYHRTRMGGSKARHREVIHERLPLERGHRAHYGRAITVLREVGEGHRPYPGSVINAHACSSRQYKGRFQKWKWRKNNTKAVQQDVLAGRSFTTSKGPTSRRPGRSQSTTKKVAKAIPLPMPNGLHELSATLLQCMRDLIHRSWKEDAVWTQPNRLGRLPVYGQELMSAVAVGLEHLAVQDTQNGFSAIRHMFRGLDDLVKKSDITIYATLLLGIPSTFYEFKGELWDGRLLNIYFLHLQSLLSHHGKGSSPLADAAHAMAQLTDKYYDEAQACLSQLPRVIADSYRDVQGCNTFDNIEWRIEAMKAVGGTSDTAETESIIIALDNMQFLSATNQGSLQSPNMIEYELWKIELLRSIEPGGKFVDRCNRLLNRIKSAAIYKEWRLWEPWLLWISGEVFTSSVDSSTTLGMMMSGRRTWRAVSCGLGVRSLRMTPGKSC
ncbi:hypothetical protein CNYM01_00119 [Colletotrichum nymphaeae SA-01]|uniref:Uncharacterized protein n=1 Tax=Colletotrichum nymphaeae SA-01 TaxID=1460502 RepID=A0A135UJR4_9PEZI|nr:hypothetical protein CNYM01_00119 [Colletotrichum nymphaeae SA-01]